jgi:DHA1 family inner membrane transport protein
MTEQPRFPLFRLLVLTGAAFVSVSSEFLPMGLLPDMAADLDVSESRVGLLVAIFAFTVVIATAPLTIITRRLSRKWLMVGTLGTIAVATLLVAAAPTYEFLVFARILGGLAHGLFWAVAGPYASRLVPREQLVRALSVTNAGGTAAFILGVPLGTALGHAFGWRLAFVVMAVVVLVFTALVIVFLPPVDHRHTLTTGEISLPYHKDRTIPAVIAVLVLTVLIVLGQNILGTYIAPWAIAIPAFSPESVAGLLFIVGAGGVVGLLLAGSFGDRFPRGAFATMLGVLLATTVIMGLFGAHQWVVIASFVVWGVAWGGVPSLLHGRTLGVASPRVRDLASAALTSAFNLAIGGGALVGGLLLDSFGVSVLPYAYAVLLVIGLAFVIIHDARHPHRLGREASAIQSTSGPR